MIRILSFGINIYKRIIIYVYFVHYINNIYYFDWALNNSYESYSFSIIFLLLLKLLLQLLIKIFGSLLIILIRISELLLLLLWLLLKWSSSLIISGNGVLLIIFQYLYFFFQTLNVLLYRRLYIRIHVI